MLWDLQSLTRCGVREHGVLFMCAMFTWSALRRPCIAKILIKHRALWEKEGVTVMLFLCLRSEEMRQY